MRLALYSDVHIDAVTGGVPRAPEIERSMWAVGRAAIEHEVDAAVFLGDLCDPEGPGGFEAVGIQRRFIDWTREHGIAWHGIPGNHCVMEWGREPRSVLSALGCDGVHDRPEIGRLCDVPTLFLPYTPSWAPYDPEEEARKFIAQHPTGKALVFGHLNLEGIHPGSEADAFARGRDVMWPLDVLGPHMDRIACFGGHIHKAQRYRGVTIVGSLARLDFGEGDLSPRFLVVDV